MKIQKESTKELFDKIVANKGIDNRTVPSMISIGTRFRGKCYYVNLNIAPIKNNRLVRFIIKKMMSSKINQYQLEKFEEYDEYKMDEALK